MRKEPSVKVTIRLPEKLLEDLREVAEAERRSFTTTVVIAAERYVAEMRAQRQAPAG